MAEYQHSDAFRRRTHMAFVALSVGVQHKLAGIVAADIFLKVSTPEQALKLVEAMELVALDGGTLPDIIAACPELYAAVP